MATATKTILRPLLRLTVVCALAGVCAVPAIMVNLDWKSPGALPWNIASAGMTLAAAVLVEAALTVPAKLTKILFGLVAAGLVAVNVNVALGNLSAHATDTSDGRKAKMVANIANDAARSRALSVRREAATVAGERSADSWQADIQAAIAKDATRWQATNECDPLKITAGQSKTYCAAIADLQSKLAAAKRRDEADAKLTKLDSVAGGDVPSTADPYTDTVEAIYGAKLSDDAKRAIVARSNAVRALMLEVGAAVVPSAILALFSFFAAAGQAPLQPKPQRVAAQPVAAPAAIVEHPIHAFIAAHLEDANGSVIRAGDAWQLWQQWCGEKGIETGSQKAFGLKLQSRFAYDRNNGRPQYLNVRAKSTLRIVADNGRVSRVA
jgi:hypothetical protein